jgi:Ran GTPase-activating protein (RanGAP) involved in mRNA processing and transport
MHLTPSLRAILASVVCEVQFLDFDEWQVQPTTTAIKLSGQQPPLQNHDLTLLAGVLRCNRIVTELDLSHNHIKAKGADSLADTLTLNHSLTKMDISHNRLKDQGGAYIAEAMLHNNSITELGMAANGFGMEVCKLLGEVIPIVKWSMQIV